MGAASAVGLDLGAQDYVKGDKTARKHSSARESTRFAAAKARFTAPINATEVRAKTKAGSAQQHQSQATESTARKLGLLADLMYNKAVRFSSYERAYGRDYRSFQRDLQHLRKIGEKHGFTVSPIKDKERVEFIERSGSPRKIDAGSAVRALIAEVAGALGTRVAQELGEMGTMPAVGGFLRFVMPRMVGTLDGSRIYQDLKAAWEAKPGPAIVEFEFESRGQRNLRRVEPYRVLLRSGRDYLVAYDLSKKAWRTFALDGICTRPRRVGTIQKLRAIPPEYDSTDAIGFFKSAGQPIRVTLELSRAVAASMISRQWQAAQKVEKLSEGRARITFEVTDVTEVVRWALGLGKEAIVVAPESAVALARKTVDEIVGAYRDSARHETVNDTTAAR